MSRVQEHLLGHLMQIDIPEHIADFFQNGLADIPAPVLQSPYLFCLVGFGQSCHFRASLDSYQVEIAVFIA
jgi:hypothetical protein